MKVTFNEGATALLFETTSVTELNKLEKFAGLNKTDGTYWIPNKLNIIHNVFGRLRSVFPRASVTPEVYARKHETEVLVPLPSEFTFFTEPLPHQLLGLKHMWLKRNLGLLADPGLGKTKMVLDYSFLLKMTQKNFKGLIVCPKALIFVWVEEALKHRPELKVHVVQGVNYKEKILSRQEAIEHPTTTPTEERALRREIAALQAARDQDVAGIRSADLVVVNYTKLVLGEQFFVTNKWSMVAIDEGLVKNPKSAQTTVITKISRKTPSRIIMSGTLINNGPEDVFSPVRILEPSVLGTSFSKFNENYGIQVKSGTQRFTVGYRKQGEIRSCLEAVSIVLRKEEWLDLPPKVFKIIAVKMSDEQRKLYDDLGANYIATTEDGQTIEVDNPLSCMCKLTQISNGFVYISDDDKESMVDLGLQVGVQGRASKKPKKKTLPVSARRTFRFKEQPKIEALKELLTTGEAAKLRVVMWYNMSAEADLIQEALESVGISYLTIRGGTGNTGEIIRSFNNDNTIQVLLCQAKAVNYGVTILGTSLEESEYEPDLSSEVFTHVFYSLNYSLEVFIQQQDRSHRIGQSRTCTYYILRSDSPTEEYTYSAILAKQEIREDFLIDITQRLRGPK